MCVTATSITINLQCVLLPHNNHSWAELAGHGKKVAVCRDLSLTTVKCMNGEVAAVREVCRMSFYHCLCLFVSTSKYRNKEDMVIWWLCHHIIINLSSWIWLFFRKSEKNKPIWLMGLSKILWFVSGDQINYNINYVCETLTNHNILW